MTSYIALHICLHHEVIISKKSKHGQMIIFGPLFFQFNLLDSVKVLLHNIFRDSLSTILSQQLSHDRSDIYLAAFKCNTTSDSPNHTVQPIRSCVTFELTNLGEKYKKKMLLRMASENGAWFPI